MKTKNDLTVLSKTHLCLCFAFCVGSLPPTVVMAQMQKETPRMETRIYGVTSSTLVASLVAASPVAPDPSHTARTTLKWVRVLSYRTRQRRAQAKAVSSAGIAVSPRTRSGFATREVGGPLTFTDVFGADGKTIELSLNPDRSYLMGMKEWGRELM